MIWRQEVAYFLNRELFMLLDYHLGVRQSWMQVRITPLMRSPELLGSVQPLDGLGWLAVYMTTGLSAAEQMFSLSYTCLESCGETLSPSPPHLCVHFRSLTCFHILTFGFVTEGTRTHLEADFRLRPWSASTSAYTMSTSHRALEFWDPGRPVKTSP